MKGILSVVLSSVTALNAITFHVAAADPVSCVVSIYNDRNGLPTGEANAVVQTPDGYVWIGSYLYDTMEPNSGISATRDLSRHRPCVRFMSISPADCG